MGRRRREGDGLGGLEVGATYVGAVVGAGFASGQEVLRFFTHFGLWGFAGLAVAGGLLAAAGAAIMLEARWSGQRTHRGLLEWLGGRWFAWFYDVVINVFLFGVLAVMVAGSGAFFQEQLGLRPLVGDLVMAAAAVATVLAGIRGVVAASEAVVPFLLGSVVLVGVAAALAPGGAVGPALAWWRPEDAAVPWWGLSACLYVSYNLVLSPAILGPLALEARSHKAAVGGGVWGGLALGAAAACVNLALLATLPESASFEVPMLHVAGGLGGGLGRVLRPVYGLVLWGEIYTTAVGVLYGLAARLAGGTTLPAGPRRSAAGPGRPGRTRARRGAGGEGLAFRRWTIGGGAAAVVAATAGFSRMVGTLYPAAGYAGLVLLGVFLWRLLAPPRPRGT